MEMHSKEAYVIGSVLMPTVCRLHKKELPTMLLRGNRIPTQADVFKTPLANNTVHKGRYNQVLKFFRRVVLL